MSGAAFTSTGLFVTSALESNGDHLLAIGSNQQVVHDLFLGNTSPDDGIAVTASGQILVAAQAGLYLVAPDFSSASLLPVTFGKGGGEIGAGGIGIGADGEIYVADPWNSRIDVMNPQYQVTGYIPTENTPVGVAVGPDGALYYRDEPGRNAYGYLGRLVRVNLQDNDQQTVLLCGLTGSGSIAFAPNGSFYLGGNGWYASSGQLLVQDTWKMGDVAFSSAWDGITLPGPSLVTLPTATPNPAIIGGFGIRYGQPQRRGFRRHFLPLGERERAGYGEFQRQQWGLTKHHGDLFTARHLPDSGDGVQ